MRSSASRASRSERKPSKPPVCASRDTRREMSRENVEAVLGLIDAWNRGDRDGWMARAHPDAEWSSAILRHVEGVEAVHKGSAELQRFWDEWHALWNVEIEVSETRDLGGTVLALA